MESKSLLRVLTAACLALSLCAAVALADEAPAAGRLMTNAERIATTDALFNAFKAADPKALAAMVVTYDDWKAQCPGLFDPEIAIPAIVDSFSPADLASMGGRDAAIESLRKEHGSMMKSFEEMKPDVIIAQLTENMNECAKSIDLSNLKIISITGAASLAPPKGGMDKLCVPTFQPIQDIEMILKVGNSDQAIRLEFDNPVFVGDVVKAAGGISCSVTQFSGH